MTICPLTRNEFNNKSLDKIIEFYEFNADQTISENSFERCLEIVYIFNHGRNMYFHSVPFLNLTVSRWISGLHIKFKNISISLFINYPSFYPALNGILFKSSDFNIKADSLIIIIMSKTVDNKLGLPYNSCYN